MTLGPWFIAVSLSACSRPAPPPAAAMTAGAIPYAVCGRYGGQSDAPSSLEAAEPAFQRAHSAYDATEYAHAAEHFARAAELLRAGDGHDHETVLRNRRIAYANMVLTLLSVDGVDTARARLHAAADDDPDLAAELLRAASALPDPPACDLGELGEPG